MSNKGAIKNANNACILQANLEHKGALTNMESEK